MALVHTIQDLVSKFELPLSVYKTSWFGDFYFVVEEITPNGHAKGKRYKNGNFYDCWFCDIHEYFVLKDAHKAVKKGAAIKSQEILNNHNPNNLKLNKALYFKGVTKLFVQRNGKLLPATFERFGVKNGMDVIYVECEGETSFYAFPGTPFVFQNRDDGARALAKKTRLKVAPAPTTLGDTQRIIAAYSKLLKARKPAENKDKEIEYELKHHKKVDEKLLQDVQDQKQIISQNQETWLAASDDFRDACIDAKESDGLFDDHTFISLEMKSQDLAKQKVAAEEKIDNLETIRKQPFFGRVDCGKSADAIYTAYIGDADIPGYVVDWRNADIGNAYYHSDVLCSQKELIIALKRTFEMQEAHLVDFDDEINIYNTDALRISNRVIEDGTDDKLTKLLAASRKDKRTHDIIKTIQSEQYDIITSDFHENAVINGCAGSGKTMILYHRLSYMAYNHAARTGESFDPKKVYVVSPSVFYDVGHSELLKKLSIDAINNGPIDDQYEKLIFKYSEKYKVAPFHLVLFLDNNYQGTLEPFQESTFECFHDKLLEIETQPILKEQYHSWIMNSAVLLLQKQGFEIPNPENKYEVALHLRQLYNSEHFIKNGPRSDSKEELTKTDEDKRKDRVEYFRKNDIVGYSYDNVIASLNTLTKSSNTYRVRLKKLAQNRDLLRMSLSTQSRRFSNGKLETNLGDFWNILEKQDVCSKLCALIVAEKLVAIALGEQYTEDDYLLRCAFTYQTLIANQFKDQIGLYCLSALTRRYGSIIKEPAYVFVDEFQNYAPMELNCLKEAFLDPVFNLYGDYDQRIEEKGITIKDAIETLFTPQTYHLSVNYRNAKEITEYINKAVYKNMLPIGVTGRVSEQRYFDCNFKTKGRTAIIAKDVMTVRRLFELRFGKDYLNVASETKTIDDNRPVLLSVLESKGLEFDTVYAFSAEMTENEKYVAYTRALDQLCVLSDDDLYMIKVSEEERVNKSKTGNKKLLHQLSASSEEKNVSVPLAGQPLEPKKQDTNPSAMNELHEPLQQSDSEADIKIPTTAEQCDDIYLEAIQHFSSDDPAVLSKAILMLESIIASFSDKLTAAVELQQEKQRAKYREINRCQHCGGEFKGLFTKICMTCGRKKDY